MNKVTRFEKGEPVHHAKLSMLLLSLSPIDKLDDNGEIDSAYSISFEANTHFRQLEHIFHHIHVNMHELALCKVGDRSVFNKFIVKKSNHKRLLM